MTTVLCIVAGTKDQPKPISARACAEAQRESRCFCLKGVPALLAVAPELEPEPGDNGEALSKKRKLREELSVLKARCTAFLRKKPSQQFSGPAIGAAQGKPTEQPLTSTVPLPSPPGKPVAKNNQPAGSLPTPKIITAPDVDDREDEHESAIAAQELNEDRPASVRKGEPKSLVGGVHAGRTSGDASESATDGVSTPPTGEKRTVHLSNRTTERTLTPTETVGAEVAGARPVSNGRSTSATRESECRPQAGVGSGSSFGLLCAGGCGGKILKTNKNGKCTRCRLRDGELDPNLKRNRDRAASRAAHEAEPVRLCSVEGCGKRLAKFNQTGKCDRCHHGIRPGGGYGKCATPGCPKKLQLHLGKDRCGLCRAGLKSHLLEKPKEESVARGPSYSEGKKCKVCPNPLANINKSGFCKVHKDNHGAPAAGVTKPRPGKALEQPAPRVAKKPELPVQAETTYPGLPPVDQVPIGWAKKLHEYLLSIGVSFATEKSAA